MTETKNLLPIGSVVLLKKGIKKLVIIGILQKDTEKNKIYDYIGVVYPEGYINNELIFLFNHDDINDIIYKGYDNPERAEFMKKAEELKQQQLKKEPQNTNDGAFE